MPCFVLAVGDAPAGAGDFEVPLAHELNRAPTARMAARMEVHGDGRGREVGVRGAGVDINGFVLLRFQAAGIGKQVAATIGVVPQFYADVDAVVGVRFLLAVEAALAPDEAVFAAPTAGFFTLEVKRFGRRSCVGIKKAGEQFLEVIVEQVNVALNRVNPALPVGAVLDAVAAIRERHVEESDGTRVGVAAGGFGQLEF